MNNIALYASLLVCLAAVFMTFAKSKRNIKTDE